MDGVRITAATVDHVLAIARAHVDSWRTTYVGLVPDAHLAALSADRQAERHRQYMARPGVRYLVAAGPAGDVLGFTSGGPSRDDDAGDGAGELYAIYLTRDHQRRGVGRALATRLAATLAADGLRSMSAWVLADNPARGFYARLGGKPERTQRIDIGGATLTEVRYVWPDLATPGP